MRTRYALVGVGGRGIGVFARSLVTDCSDVADLVALCDVNPQRMEVDLADRYHGPDIDGVVRRLEWGRGPAIRISPLFGRPYAVEVERREGGHGGADERIREHLFRPDTADPLGQRADSRAGAMSVLLGAAGNLSIESGEPVRVADPL